MEVISSLRMPSEAPKGCSFSRWRSLFPIKSKEEWGVTELLEHVVWVEGCTKSGGSSDEASHSPSSSARRELRRHACGEPSAPASTHCKSSRIHGKQQKGQERLGSGQHDDKGEDDARVHPSARTHPDLASVLECLPTGQKSKKSGSLII
jgi:hypothetical protein